MVGAAIVMYPVRANLTDGFMAETAGGFRESHGILHFWQVEMHDQLDFDTSPLCWSAASREFFTGYFLFFKIIFCFEELVSDR